MSNFIFRKSSTSDIPFLAKIRARNSATEEYWTNRITGYNNGTINPQKAEPSRIIFIASHIDEIIGFIAGHLTKRYDCDGELQWIDVLTEYRRLGLASKLLKELANWFINHKCYKICVDPGNDDARKFYSKSGATNLNEHWMYWADITKIK
jgi:ribosomal protein S18 acetylase RimI-like enzyme